MLPGAILLALLLQITGSSDPCASIDSSFRLTADPNDSHTSPCKCLIDPVPADPNDRLWIGCTGRSLSTVFSALGALNETRVNRVHIWDSQLNILPTEMFEKVRPKILIIENSMTSVIRQNTFSQIGNRLIELRLRNNALKKNIGPALFKGLERLQALDLSGNKLMSIKAGDFEALGDLRELHLNDNIIKEIEDGSFSALSSLRTLSLQGNQLSTITRDTFKGLDNLEYLYLNHNQIANIDWAAFHHLKNLKHLYLGRNHITTVDIRGLESLEKLILNNNSIQSLKKVSLKDLPSLAVLSLDRNSIAEIDDVDLFGLAPSTRLESLSLASNNVSRITARAFQHIPSLKTLALQNNQLLSLSTGTTPVLKPLRRLSVLLLSGNMLTALREAELPAGLTVLSVARNQISHVDVHAFNEMRLQRLFLNDNRITFLPKGTFDSLDMDVLQAVDLTENQWQCVCGEEWLGGWLDKAGERDIGEGALGCLAASCGDNKKDIDRAAWVTISASILAILSILILIAIAFLYIENGQHKGIVSRPFRRVDSDMLKLINENEAKSDADRGVEQPKLAKSGDSTKKSVRFT
ncbi:unnamed protein product, partial [Mesorhabditis spiculigera]